MLLISMVFGAVLESLCFFIGFFLCRKFSGGYHAATYTKCHILFIINQIAFLLLLNCINNNYYWLATIVAIIISIIIIFLIAPIDHPNKPFTTKEMIKFRKRSKYFAIVLVPAYILFYLIDKNNPFSFCFSIGVLSVSLSLLYAFFERRKNTNEKV